MSRRDKKPEGDLVARPGAPHVIDPHACYTIPTATAALGLRKECLPREIRAGRLQARKRGGRYWILGAWLLAWVESGVSHPRWPATPARTLPLPQRQTGADQAAHATGEQKAG